MEKQQDAFGEGKKMRKIKWKNVPLYPKDKVAIVDGVRLDCGYEDRHWCSYVCFGGAVKIGSWFYLLKDAQEDCIQLAKQMLIDHHECLTSTMKSFDVSCEEIG